MGSHFETLTADPALFSDCGAVTAFAPGEVFVQDNQHYQYFFLLLSGEVVASREGGASREAVSRRVPPGALMALESFLTGRPTAAHCRAATDVQALRIDDRAWLRFESAAPEDAARLRREVRRREELAMADAGGAIEIFACRTAEMLRRAQRLRYAIYCDELGRDSPHADPEARILADELDDFGYVFLAMRGDTPIGTLRVNQAAQGSLGALEEIYGMKASPHHPMRTVVCTKFMVAKPHRRGLAAFRLLAAVLACGVREKMAACYIDATPELIPLYASMGFEVAGPAFAHPENGPSFPMALDLDAKGRHLMRRFCGGADS